MMTESLYIAVVALMWGGYPLVSRSTQVPGPLGALILSVCALLPIAVATYWDQATARPSTPDVTKLAFAGLMMGTGTTAFNTLATSRRLDASVTIPIADTAMLLVTVLGAIVFFHEPITARKLAGIAMLVGGIMILKPA